MADIPKLMLKPERDGYSANLGYGVISTETEYGMPRQRLDGVGKPHIVSAKYRCTRSQWQYMLAFLRVYKGLPFLAYLLLDDLEPTWYEVRIVSDGKLQFSTIHEQVFDITLNLICKPIYYDVELDKTITEIYNMANGEMDEYFNLLEKLVNQDLYNATKSLI